MTSATRCVNAPHMSRMLWFSILALSALPACGDDRPPYPARYSRLLTQDRVRYVLGAASSAEEQATYQAFREQLLGREWQGIARLDGEIVPIRPGTLRFYPYQDRFTFDLQWRGLVVRGELHRHNPREPFRNSFSGYLSHAVPESSGRPTYPFKNLLVPAGNPQVSVSLGWLEPDHISSVRLQVTNSPLELFGVPSLDLRFVSTDDAKKIVTEEQ